MVWLTRSSILLFFVLFFLLSPACATLMLSTQEVYDGDYGPPTVTYGGTTGDGTPWARVSNGLGVPVEVVVECPEKMRFELPPRTSQRFFVTRLVSDEDRVCKTAKWRPIIQKK